jgi:hypothetical protein
MFQAQNISHTNMHTFWLLNIPDRLLLIKYTFGNNISTKDQMASPIETTLIQTLKKTSLVKQTHKHFVREVMCYLFVIN